MTPGEQNQVVTPMLQISNNLTSDEVSPEEDLDPLLPVEDSLIPPLPSSLSLLIWMRNCSRSFSLPKSHPNTQPVFLQFCCTSFVFNIYDADGLCRAAHSIPAYTCSDIKVQTVSMLTSCHCTYHSTLFKAMFYPLRKHYHS